MKKKLLATVLALFLCGAFMTACGNNNNSGNTGDSEVGGTVEHKHALTFVGEQSSTCDKDGNSAYYICKGCGKWFSDGNGTKEIEDKDSIILPAGHKLRSVDAREATCFQDGNSAYFVCLGCGKWFYDGNGDNEIENKSGVTVAAGHRIRYAGAKNPTCTADGNIAHYTCIGCGELFTDAEGKEVIEDKSSVIVPKIPHELTHIEQQEPTCSKAGNSEYYSCGKCNKWFNDSKGTEEIYDKSSVILKKAHQFVDKICSVCGTHAPTDGIIFTETSNGCTINGIEGSKETEIYVAEEYNGKTVTAIDDSAFENYTTLVSISLPDSINFIGGSAFKGCTSLKSITIPQAVNFIGGYAFEDCESLESVTLPDGLETIADSVFKGCVSLTEIEFPESQIYIGNRAFEGCEKLTSIEIPDSVRHLGEYAFTGCVKLAEVILGSGIVDIVSGVFSDCESLTTITIPNSVTSIGNYAIGNCVNLAYIIFKGTSTQWKNIEKGYRWDEGTGDCTVQCTDKNINKNESADE